MKKKIAGLILLVVLIFVGAVGQPQLLTKFLMLRDMTQLKWGAAVAGSAAEAVPMSSPRRSTSPTKGSATGDVRGAGSSVRFPAGPVVDMPSHYVCQFTFFINLPLNVIAPRRYGSPVHETGGSTGPAASS